MKRRLQRQAFSLVELVMVVVIVGLLASMAIPRYANSIARRRADAAAGRMVADLRLARQRARLTSAGQTVSFDAAEDSYTLLGVQHLDRAGDTYQVLLAEDPYNVALESADFGGDTELVFDGYGMPSSGGTVVISIGDEVRTITVDADTGRASIQ